MSENTCMEIAKEDSGQVKRKMRFVKGDAIEVAKKKYQKHLDRNKDLCISSHCKS